MWPMKITQQGEMYSYCPGKATWDRNAVSIYQALVITEHTGIMYEDGPLSEQPPWWIDLCSWFLPYYSDHRFYSRARAILGDGKAETGTPKTGRK